MALQPDSSHVETDCVDAEPQEEKEKLDMHEDGCCNVMCDDDHQLEDQFYECNGNDDFDVEPLLCVPKKL